MKICCMLHPTNINRTIVAASLVAGLACRYATLDQVTGDTGKFLLPWYEFARVHGVASLGQAFTNYTPFYSYLLLAATKFDGLFEPWHLIKAISLVFEFGCAVIAARIVAVGEGSRYAPAIAFAACWLAPTVLFNGAVWGQADSIWTFFVLLSVYFVCRDKPIIGIIAFAVGFAVKAQAVFLAPLIFALVLRRTVHWLWLAAIPAVYLVVAAPAWLLGQSLLDILTVYLKQAGTFERLSMNAANMWLFVPNRFYELGVGFGLAISAAAGLAFSVFAARVKERLRVEQVVAAAAISLLLMPFVLPKMHDRYFYAFEVMAIVLAFLKPRLSVIAIAAQIDGVLAYLAYYGVVTSALYLAAVGNGWILFELIRYAWRKASKPDVPDSLAFSPIKFVVGANAFWITYLLVA
jgi:Gpi18-like mannosyltransferase